MATQIVATPSAPAPLPVPVDAKTRRSILAYYFWNADIASPALRELCAAILAAEDGGNE